MILRGNSYDFGVVISYNMVYIVNSLMDKS